MLFLEQFLKVRPKTILKFDDLFLSLFLFFLQFLDPFDFTFKIYLCTYQHYPRGPQAKRYVLISLHPQLLASDSLYSYSCAWAHAANWSRYFCF